MTISRFAALPVHDRTTDVAHVSAVPAAVQNFISIPVSAMPAAVFPTVPNKRPRLDTFSILLYSVVRLDDKLMCSPA